MTRQVSGFKQRSMDEAIVLFDDIILGYEIEEEDGESSTENAWIT